MKKPTEQNWRPTKLDLVINDLINGFEQQEMQGDFRSSPIAARIAEKERNKKIIEAVLNAHNVARLVP